MSILEVKNLGYVYGEGTPYKKVALKDVNLAVNKGDIIGIIGHTGSGKSTLLQHLNGLIKPTSGQILFEGKDICGKDFDIRTLRFKVGLVFQYPEYQLFEDTAFKDISYGPKNMGLNDDEINNRVITSAKLLHIRPELLEKSPFDLSGGEKRRVAIAGIIAMKPDVLILDEPTAGLDPKGAARINELILKYREETGAAIIFVSHSMETVAEVAEKVLVMDHGQAVMFDRTEEIFNKAETLKEMGLSVPEVTEIFIRLKQKGFNVSTNIFTVQQAKAEIDRLLKEAERC